MGKEQSKEKIVIAQNAAGGVNSADVELIHHNQKVTNIILGIFLLLLILGAKFAIYKLYKRCHINWMRQEMVRSAFRRSRRGPETDERNQERVV